MNEHVNRLNVVKVDGTTAFCFTTLSTAVNGTLLDISDSCSDGFEEYLDTYGLKGISYSIEGYTKDADMMEKAMSGSVKYTGAVIEYWNGSQLACDLVIESFETGGAQAEVETFTASLKTSGEYTFTPASP